MRKRSEIGATIPQTAEEKTLPLPFCEPENLGALVKAIEEKKFKISLMELTQMDPTDRQALLHWVDGKLADTSRVMELLKGKQRAIIINMGSPLYPATPAPSVTTMADARELGTSVNENPQTLPKSQVSTIGVLQHANAESAANTVSYTYGSEVFTPVPYNTFHIGPFAGTTSVRAGETHTQALARLQREIEAFAKSEFDRKSKDFLAKVSGLKGKS